MDRAEITRLLEERPAAATPRLARELKERVEAVWRTDARAARRLAECVAIVADRCGDLESAIHAARAKALAAMAAGAFREALEEYRLAERLCRERGDDLELGRVLRSMIEPLAHVGRAEEARAVAEEAREIFRRRHQPLLVAEVETNLGNLLHRLDRQEESLDAYDRARAAFRVAGKSDALALVEFNRANVFTERGDLEEAERGYRAAGDWYAAEGQRLRELQCLYALAYVAFLRGKPTEALRGFARVRELGRSLGDRRHVALCDLDEAEVLLDLGAWEEARARAADARAPLRELGLSIEAARADLYAAVADLHGRRFDRAARGAAAAGHEFQSLGNGVLAALARLYRAEIELLRGDPREAVRAARAAARSFSAQGMGAKEAYARVVAARALTALGHQRFAGRQAEAALRCLERSPGAGVEWRALHTLALLAEEPGELRARLLQAIRVIERLRSDVVPDELRATLHRDTAALFEDLAGAILDADPDTPRLEAVFAAIEAGRARGLDDALGRRMARGAGAATGRSSAWRQGLDELNALYSRLNEAEREGSARSLAGPLRREIEAAEGALERLHRQIALGEDESPPQAPWAADEDLLTRVADCLDPEEVVIETFFLRDWLHAIQIRREGARWIPRIAPRAAIDEALMVWLFQARATGLGPAHLAAHRRSLGRAAVDALDALSAILWAPLSVGLDEGEAVIVVPSGPLFHVPFHALREARRFVIERRQVAVAPSGRSLLPEPGGPARGMPLVVGLERPGLPAVTREVAAVASRLPGARVLAEAGATRQALRSFAPGASVVHIAAHAEYRHDNPLLSSLEMTDGRFTLYELVDLDLAGSLVVLSGCRTGWTRAGSGMELLGLAGGFRRSGAAALIASLWDIADEATAEFMAAFYDALAGTGPRPALAEAMRRRIEAGALPHEWAPFQLSGSAGSRRAIRGTA
jgi:hypothetical protein